MPLIVFEIQSPLIFSIHIRSNQPSWHQIQFDMTDTCPEIRFLTDIHTWHESN